MIQAILIALFDRLISRLIAYFLEQKHAKDEKAVTDEEIDERAKAFKLAFKDAFDGTNVTPEQRVKLRQAIRDFILNPKPKSNSDSAGL